MNMKLQDALKRIFREFGMNVLKEKRGHLKISVVPIATSAKNPCTPKEEKWQVLYPMDL